MLTSLLALTLAGFATAANYTNPIRTNGADPFIVYDKPSGKYWFLSTTYQDLQITSASTLEGLKSGDRQIVYTDAYTVGNGTTWAPEIHNVDGTWHLYFSLDYHAYVLKGADSPGGPYTNPVKLYDEFGIDGTVLNLNDANYFVWSCLRPLAGYDKDQQSICISPLTTPTSIDVNNIGIISQPDQPWEQIGTSAVPAVNEGPQPLYWAGETYLTYSASYCGTSSYSIGLLRYTGGDPVQPASWKKKTDGPVFASNNGEYGTGHNGIFLSPDGTQMWNVFHAVTNPAGSCGQDRNTFALVLDTSDFDPAVGPRFGQIPPEVTQLFGPSGEF